MLNKTSDFYKVSQNSKYVEFCHWSDSDYEYPCRFIYPTPCIYLFSLFSTATEIGFSFISWNLGLYPLYLAISSMSLGIISCPKKNLLLGGNMAKYCGSNYVSLLWRFTILQLLLPRSWKQFLHIFLSYIHVFFSLLDIKSRALYMLS